MPARSGADQHARRQQGLAFVSSLEDPEKNDLRRLSEIAFWLPNADAVTITQDAIAFAGRGHGDGLKTSRATVHRIEEHATLRAWLKRQIDMRTIFAEAQDHAVMADRLAASLDDDELHPQDRDEIAAAYEGRTPPAVLALAELALAPVANDIDRIFDATHATVATRPQLQAGLIIAIAARPPLPRHARRQPLPKGHCRREQAFPGTTRTSCGRVEGIPVGGSLCARARLSPFASPDKEAMRTSALTGVCFDSGNEEDAQPMGLYPP